MFPETYGAEYEGEKITLTPKEYEILELFARNAGKIINHETLLTRIWGYDFDGNEGIIHASMKKLRDKIPSSIIRTIKGVGYCLEVEDDDLKKIFRYFWQGVFVHFVDFDICYRQYVFNFL